MVVLLDSAMAVVHQDSAMATAAHPVQKMEHLETTIAVTTAMYSVATVVHSAQIAAGSAITTAAPLAVALLPLAHPTVDLPLALPLQAMAPLVPAASVEVIPEAVASEVEALEVAVLLAATEAMPAVVTSVDIDKKLSTENDAKKGKGN